MSDSEVTLPDEVPSLPPSVPGSDADEHLASDAVADEFDMPDDCSENDMMSDQPPPDVQSDDDQCDNMESMTPAEETHHFSDIMGFQVHTVPGVEDAVSGTHNVAEIYSPPRLLPAARRLGLLGSLSLDVLTGWDFRCASARARSLEVFALLGVTFVMTSPPCTLFSVLQTLWNFKRMDARVVEMRMAEAKVFLNHSMDVCSSQDDRGDFFGFEHPANSLAWEEESVRTVLQRPSTRTVTFDQCMCGLRSPVHGTPICKRTRIMTNSVHLVNAFSNCKCDKSHQHQRCEGSEGGIRLSVWAQCYPEPMVQRMAGAVSLMVHDKAAGK